MHWRPSSGQQRTSLSGPTAFGLPQRSTPRRHRCTVRVADHRGRAEWEAHRRSGCPPSPCIHVVGLAQGKLRFHDARQALHGDTLISCSILGAHGRDRWGSRSGTCAPSHARCLQYSSVERRCTHLSVAACRVNGASSLKSLAAQQASRQSSQCKVSDLSEYTQHSYLCML